MAEWSPDCSLSERAGDAEMLAMCVRSTSGAAAEMMVTSLAM
jgi:hypothetical protein